MKRRFKAVLLEGEKHGYYGAGVEERVKGETAWFGSFYFGPFANRKEAQNELIRIIDGQCKPGDQIILKIPDYSLYKRTAEFSPRFLIFSEKLKRMKPCVILCEDALQRETTITEYLKEE